MSLFNFTTFNIPKTVPYPLYMPYTLSSNKEQSLEESWRPGKIDLLPFKSRNRNTHSCLTQQQSTGSGRVGLGGRDTFNNL